MEYKENTTSQVSEANFHAFVKQLLNSSVTNARKFASGLLLLQVCYRQDHYIEPFHTLNH